MKNRLWRTVISLLLVCCMLLAACGTTGKESEDGNGNGGMDSEQDKGETGEEEAQEDYDPLGKYEEPITITSVKGMSPYLEYDESIEGLESPTDNLWLDVYRDELGINLEYLWTTYEDTYDERWNAMLADGEVPDIGYVSWPVYEQLLEADMVQDMTDYFDKYASDLYKEAVEMEPMGEELITVDGRMMGLPNPSATAENISLLWIRKDWLEAVDMPVPTTLEEVVSLAKAFKEAKLGGENTIGLPISQNLNDNLVGCRGIFNAFGVYPDIWLEGEDGQLEYGIVQPEMKEALQVLQDMYAEGLLPEDFAVKDNNQILELVASGQAGMLYSVYWAPNSSAMATFENDDWIVTSIPMEDGSPAVCSDTAKPWYFFYVRKGFEHPEAAVKIVNLGFEIRYNWENGMQDYFVWEDGTSAEYARFDVWHIRPWEQLTMHEEIEEAILNGTVTDTVERNQTLYEQCKEYYEDPEGTTGVARLSGLVYGIGGSYDIVGKLRDDGRILTDQYNGILSNDSQMILNDVNTILWAEYTKIVMGQDIDTFEAAVENWHNNGGDKVTQVVNGQ